MPLLTCELIQAYQDIDKRDSIVKKAVKFAIESINSIVAKAHSPNSTKPLCAQMHLKTIFLAKKSEVYFKDTPNEHSDYLVRSKIHFIAQQSKSFIPAYVRRHPVCREIRIYCAEVPQWDRQIRDHRVHFEIERILVAEPLCECRQPQKILLLHQAQETIWLAELYLKLREGAKSNKV